MVSCSYDGIPKTHLSYIPMSATVILKQLTNSVGMTYTQPALLSKEGTKVLMRRKQSYIPT